MLFWNDELRPRLGLSTLRLLGGKLAQDYLLVDESPPPSEHLELIAQLEQFERKRLETSLH